MKVYYVIVMIPKNVTDYVKYIKTYPRATRHYLNLDETFIAMNKFTTRHYFFHPNEKDNLHVLKVFEYPSQLKILINQIYDHELTSEDNHELFKVKEQSQELESLMMSRYIFNLE